MWSEIMQTISMTTKRFQIKTPSKGKAVATQLQDIVDDILKGNSYPKEYQSIKDVAIALGIYFGYAICIHYKWEWKMLGEDSENSIVSVVSPKENFSIEPMDYVLKILEMKNIGLDEKNDNTILLLFNMLDGIDEKPRKEKYCPLS